VLYVTVKLPAVAPRATRIPNGAVLGRGKASKAAGRSIAAACTPISSKMKKAGQEVRFAVRIDIRIAFAVLCCCGGESATPNGDRVKRYLLATICEGFKPLPNPQNLPRCKRRAQTANTRDTWLSLRLHGKEQETKERKWSCAYPWKENPSRRPRVHTPNVLLEREVEASDMYCLAPSKRYSDTYPLRAPRR
jgi:hypothetical protein